MTQTNESVHGHEIMNLVIIAGGSMGVHSLKVAAEQKYGKDARYHTCSAENLSFDQLIDLLIAKGKFAAEGMELTFNDGSMCSG